MNYSTIKTIRALCDSLASSPDWREVVRQIEDGEDDFEVDGVRFINDAEIDRIQCEELESDLYPLGYFNAGFLADVLGIDQDVIECMQKAEAYEAIGKLIISMGKLEELQQDYARYDGYGHHFNHYDGEEEELYLGDAGMYHVFDNQEE